MGSAPKHHIMAIGAHIGDVENQSGLLLAKYAAAGHKATDYLPRRL